MKNVIRHLTILIVILCFAPAFADDSSGMVQGTLVDDRNGQPAAHVTISLDGYSALLHSATDANGHFVFLTVPPGRYAITVNADYTLGGRCKPQPIIDVDAGISWSLPPMRYGRRQMVFAVCSRGPDETLQQLLSAGTTASMYIIRAPFP